MIVDGLARYLALHPSFVQAFSFIRQCQTKLPPPGEYEISGREIYAMVQHYDTQPCDDLAWEGHRRYIDIQALLSGSEIIQFAPLDHAQSGVYDPSTDLFHCLVQDPTDLLIHTGQFVILYPEDLHRPKCRMGAACAVNKLVIKILL